MRDERARILDFVQQGKVTVAEAEDLLDALGPPPKRANGGSDSPARGHHRPLHIRITDTKTGSVKTNIRLPAQGWAFATKLTRTKLGRHLGGLALDDIERAAREGVTGNILESTNEKLGERVEIFFE